MKIVREILIYFSLIAFMCMLSQVLYWNWQASAELVIYPSSDIQKTAEYLYANPLPTPIEHRFYPEPGQIYIPSGYPDFCVYGENFINSWLINGSHLHQSMYSQLSSAMLIQNCLRLFDRISLPDGIHLVEVRFGGLFSTFFPFLPSPNSYQWAFKIEPTPTLSPTPTP